MTRTKLLSILQKETDGFNELKLVKMKQTINDFINSIDTKLYSRIRASKGDAECRRYLKEHLAKQCDIQNLIK